MAQAVSPPPLNTTPLEFDEKTKRADKFADVWQRFFTNWWNALRAPANAFTPPATSASAIFGGGVIAWDQNFLYVSTGPNQWKRIPLTNF